MDLIDDPESDDPHARLSSSKAVHKSLMSPVIAAAEMFHEGGPSHPAFSESSVSYRWQGSLGFSERGSIVLRGGSGQRTSVRNIACCGVLHRAKLTWFNIGSSTLSSGVERESSVG